MHILLVVLVTFGITVYGFLPSLEEALVRESRQDEKRVRGVNDAKRLLGGYAMKGPGTRGADLTEEAGVGARRYLLPCPDLPSPAVAGPPVTPYGSDGVSETGCHQEPTNATGANILGDDWLNQSLETMRSRGGRAGFLPEEIFNPYSAERPNESLFNVPPGALTRPLYLVSRNVVREDRPLNPTNLVRLPRTEWLSLSMDRYINSVSNVTVSYGLDARIAFIVVSPGDPWGDPCNAASTGRNAAGERITDWTDLFLRDNGTCGYPPRLRADDGGIPRTQDRIAYLSVEQLVTGGTGVMEDLEQSAAELDRIISGDLYGVGLRHALEGYYEKHGFFPDPAAFDIGTGTRDGEFRHDDTGGAATPLPLAGVPHAEALLRTGGIDSVPVTVAVGEEYILGNPHLLQPSTETTIHTVLKTRKKSVRVNIPENIGVNATVVEGVSYRPPFSTFPLDPSAGLVVATDASHIDLPTTLPVESSYRSAEPLGLQPRAPDLACAGAGGAVPCDSVLGMTVRIPTDDVGYNSGIHVSAARAFRSHMEMEMPAGMQLFAAAGEARLRVPSNSLASERLVQTTVTVSTGPGTAMEQVITVPVADGSLYVRSHDGGVIDYDLEADVVGISQTPIGLAASTGRVRQPFPSRAPIRTGNKGFLPVDSILGDLPSRLDPDRAVARPMVDLNLICHDGTDIAVVTRSATGDCPLDVSTSLITATVSLTVGTTGSDGAALRMLAPTEMEFLVFPSDTAEVGVMVETFPYLSSPFRRSVDAFRLLANPAPFRIPAANQRIGFTSQVRPYDGTTFLDRLGDDPVDIDTALSPVQFRLPAGTQLVLPLADNQEFALGREFQIPEGLFAVAPAGTRVPGVIAPNSTRPDGRRYETAGTDALVENVALPRGGIVHFNNGTDLNTVYISPRGRASHSDIVRDRQIRNLGFEVMGEGVELAIGSTTIPVAPGCTILPYRPAWYCGTRTFRLTNPAAHLLGTDGNAIMEVKVLGASVPPVYRARRDRVTPVAPLFGVPQPSTTMTLGDFNFAFDSANALGHTADPLTSYAGYPTDYRDPGNPATLAPPDLVVDESARFLLPSGTSLTIQFPAAPSSQIVDISTPSSSAPAVLNDYIRTLYGHAVFMEDIAGGGFGLDHSQPAVLNPADGYFMADAVAVERNDFDVLYVGTTRLGALPITGPAIDTRRMELILEPSAFAQPVSPAGVMTLLPDAMRANYTAIPYGDILLTGLVDDGIGGFEDIGTVVVRDRTPIDIMDSINITVTPPVNIGDPPVTTAVAGLDVRVRSPYGGGTFKRGLAGGQPHASPKLRPHYEMVGIVRQPTTLTILQPYSLDRYAFDAGAGEVTPSTEMQAMSLTAGDEVAPPTGFVFGPSFLLQTDPGDATALPFPIPAVTTTLTVVTIDIDFAPPIVFGGIMAPRQTRVTVAQKPVYRNLLGYDVTMTVTMTGLGPPITTTTTVTEVAPEAAREFVLPAGARVLVPGHSDYDYGTGALHTDRIVIMNYEGVYSDPATQGTYEVLDFRSGRQMLLDRGQPASTRWAETEVDLFPKLELTLAGLDMFAPSGGVLYRELDEQSVAGTGNIGEKLTTFIDDIPAGSWLDVAEGEQEWRGNPPGLQVETLPQALATVVRDYPMAYAVAEECRQRHNTGPRELEPECASGEGEGLNMLVAPGSWIDVPSDTPLAAPMMLVRAASATRYLDDAITSSGQIGGYRVRGYDPATGQPRATFTDVVTQVVPGTDFILQGQEPGSIGYGSAAWILVDNINGEAIVAHGADPHVPAGGGAAVQGSPFTVMFDFAGNAEFDDLVVLPLDYAGPGREPDFLDRTGLEVIFLHPDEDADDFRDRLVNLLTAPPGAVPGALEYEFSNAVRAVSYTPITLYPGGQFQRLDGQFAVGHVLANIPDTARIELAPAVLFRDGRADLDQLFETGAWHGQRDLTHFRPVPGTPATLVADLDGQLALGYDFRGIPLALPASNLTLYAQGDTGQVFLDTSQQLVMAPGFSWSGVILDETAVTFNVMPETGTATRTETPYANRASLYFRSYPDIDGIDPAEITVADILGTDTTVNTSDFTPLWNNDYQLPALPSVPDPDMPGDAAWSYYSPETTVTVHLTHNERGPAPANALSFDEGEGLPGAGVGGIDDVRPVNSGGRAYTSTGGSGDLDPFAVAVTLTLPGRVLDTRTQLEEDFSLTLAGGDTFNIFYSRSRPVSLELVNFTDHPGAKIASAPNFGSSVYASVATEPTYSVPLEDIHALTLYQSLLTVITGLSTMTVPGAAQIAMEGREFRPVLRPAPSTAPETYPHFIRCPLESLPLDCNSGGPTVYYGRFESRYDTSATPPAQAATYLGYAYGETYFRAIRFNHFDFSEPLQGADSPFFGLGNASAGSVPIGGQQVGSTVMLAADLDWQLHLPDVTVPETVTVASTETETIDTTTGITTTTTTNITTTLAIAQVRSPPMYDEAKAHTNVVLRLGAGASFSLNRTNRMQTTLRFGADFRIDGYAAIWPRYDSGVQSGWGLTAPDAAQQVYFERLSAEFVAITADPAVSLPSNIWLVMPEPVREMRRADGTMISVYAGSMINPVTGEVLLARPFPVDAILNLSEEAEGAVEGNFADAIRPVVLTNLVANNDALIAYPDQFGASDGLNNSTDPFTTGVTFRGGRAGAYGNLCYVPGSTRMNALSDFQYTPNTSSADPTNRNCSSHFDDLEIDFRSRVPALLSTPTTVAWDLLSGSESWLLFDATATPPGAAGQVGYREQVGFAPQDLLGFYRRMNNRFLKPVRNVSNFRVAPGAIAMPAFRQAAPAAVGYVFPPGSIMEAASPDPGSDSPEMRTSDVDVGGAGVPSIIRTPGKILNVQMSVSLMIDPVTDSFSFRAGAVWDPATTAGLEVDRSDDPTTPPTDMFFPKYYGWVAPGTSPNLEAELTFDPINTTMFLETERDTDAVPEEFLDLEIRQNVWITIKEDIQVVTGGTTLRLLEGTVLNPMFGTYLPAADRRRSSGRLETRARAYVTPIGSLELTRPALVLPKGSKFYAARGASLRNVQAAVFFSPYPLEAAEGCAAQPHQFAAGQVVSGFRISQLTEGVSEGSPNRTFDPISTGHICALLDTNENTDFDDWYTFYSASQRPRNSRDRRIEVNDRVYPVGGRLVGAFPNP